MPNVTSLAILVASFAMFPVAASAAPAPDHDQTSAFLEQPVSSDELADSYGGSARTQRSYRLLADNDATGFLQQISQTSRVAMDNWWVETGAVLIDNNILARP